MIRAQFNKVLCFTVYLITVSVCHGRILRINQIAIKIKLDYSSITPVRDTNYVLRGLLWGLKTKTIGYMVGRYLMEL